LSLRYSLASEKLVTARKVGFVELPMRSLALIATAAALGLAVPATAAAPPEVVKLRKQVATLNAKVKQLTAQRNAARREVAALKARLAPKPTGRWR
jgi:outer membrane murein-binding lipoprotein Lpp